MRSVVVVLPASMWAMMPMLRVFASDVSLGISISCRFPPQAELPTVVCERFVGFGHAVNVFALLHRAAAEIGRVHALVGEPFLHRRAVPAIARTADDPADAQRQAAVRIHLDRDLSVR